MKHTKTVNIPATTKQVFDYAACDFCGEKLKSNGFEYDEITILRHSGVRYPGCHTSEKTEFDCCPDCWEGKILPALKSLGAKPAVTEDES